MVKGKECYCEATLAYNCVAVSRPTCLGYKEVSARRGGRVYPDCQFYVEDELYVGWCNNKDCHKKAKANLIKQGGVEDEQ